MTDLSKLLWRVERVERMGTYCDDWRAEILEQIANHPDAALTLDLAAVLVELADCFSRLGRHNDAVSTVRRSLELDAVPPYYRRLDIANVFRRAGRLDDAEALYKAMKAEAPDNLWLYFDVGDEYQEAGEHQRAIEWLDEGLQRATETGDSESVAFLLANMKADSVTALWLADVERQKAAARASAPKRKRRA